MHFIFHLSFNYCEADSTPDNLELTGDKLQITRTEAPEGAPRGDKMKWVQKEN